MRVPEMKFIILSGHKAPALKLELYEGTVVRSNNPTHLPGALPSVLRNIKGDIKSMGNGKYYM